MTEKLQATETTSDDLTNQVQNVKSANSGTETILSHKFSCFIQFQ